MLEPSETCRRGTASSLYAGTRSFRSNGSSLAAAASVFLLLSAAPNERSSCFAVRIKRRKPTSLKNGDKRADPLSQSNNKSESGRSPWEYLGLNAKDPATDVASRSFFSDLINESIDAMHDSIAGSVQRPMRDLWDGMWTAAMLSWNGYSEGVRGMTLDYPFRRPGFVNLLAGSSAGVFHFALLTTSGVAAAGYQIVRGAARTMEAMKSMAQGKVWNYMISDWEFYSLDEEVRRADSMSEPTKSTSSSSSSSTQSPPRRLRKRVRDKTYYDLLEIPVDASTSQIKKAYYRQALQVHPDKTSSEDSAAHFQKLSSVYQTLVSGAKREMYDQHGVCFEQQMPDDSTAHVDPYIFFSILFDSAVVEPYTGTLAIPTIVDNALQLTARAQTSSSQMDYDRSPIQQRRQVAVATHLRERIQDLHHNVNATESFRNEAMSLSMAIGSPIHADLLLRAIGSALMSGTSKFFTPSWSSQVTNWIQDAIKGTKATTVSWQLENIIQQAVVQTDDVSVNNTDTVNECDADNSNDRGNKKGVEVEALLMKLSTPKVMRLVWDFNMHDILQTIHRACQRVVDDCGQDLELRQRRASALFSLGREFWNVANNLKQKRREHGDPKEIQQNVHLALQNSIKSESDMNDRDEEY